MLRCCADVMDGPSWLAEWSNGVLESLSAGSDEAPLSSAARDRAGGAIAPPSFSRLAICCRPRTAPSQRPRAHPGSKSGQVKHCMRDREGGTDQPSTTRNICPSVLSIGHMTHDDAAGLRRMYEQWAIDSASLLHAARLYGRAGRERPHASPGPCSAAKREAGGC